MLKMRVMMHRKGGKKESNLEEARTGSQAASRDSKFVIWVRKEREMALTVWATTPLKDREHLPRAPETDSDDGKRQTRPGQVRCRSLDLAFASTGPVTSPFSEPHLILHLLFS